MSVPQGRTFTAQLGNARITFETGRVAQQAGGSVLIRSDDSVLLATATASKSAREGIDFLPLSVDFEEKLYAAGRIPGSFFRREGRPSEDAVLVARLVDRPLRPLFDKTIRNDLQVIITALSSDNERHLDIMAVNAASAALMISDIPWGGPVGAVRIGLIDGQLVASPTVGQMENSLLDLRVAGTRDAILMVEAGANEVPEATLLDALRLAHEAIQEVIEVQLQMQAEVGKPKREMIHVAPNPEARALVEPWLADKIQPVLEATGSKHEKAQMQEALKEELLAAFAEDEAFTPADLTAAFNEIFREQTRRRILEEQIRPDGRRPDEIRPIWCQVGLLPRVHGSGLFTRGETQVLSIATLGMPDDEQRLDTLSPRETKRYLHHYNFPPYCTGETGRLGGTRRREVGHGALAERALLPVLPPEEDFPYVLRVVSETLSSNGSSSMASVCGSTLSLMDAGVPIKAPVSGIAMGLVTDPEDDRFVILSDIQGMEDALGDMDFKIAGTRKGVTALQMDIKIKGLPWPVLEQALEQARAGRHYILDLMAEAIAEPRPDISPYAPRITTMHVDPELIGKIIGPGGKTVRAIQDETGARISIEDDGTVYIATNDGEAAALAKSKIEELVAVPEIGAIYTGKVVRITDFGAFVEILPGTDGMVHISQLADYRVRNVRDVIQEGDEIMVMVTDIDREGKIRLSRQAVLEGWTPEEARAHDRVPAGGRRGGGNRGGGRDRRGGSRGGGGRDRRGGSRR
ncbi:MAG: polyribonucleotide nucleotidyltransferase [Caldilineae bacterium]|nr:MAG: polyribonucleotide nucleotidyltransferase [Caldilineae bacterium]